jgi:OOP family OmpA-OmpF porin
MMRPQQFFIVLSLSLVLSQAGNVVADPITDLLQSIGAGQLKNVTQPVGDISASVLDPNGTGDNDFVGADLLNSENDLGITFVGSELLGFGSNTGTGTAIPLDALGLSQLLDALGLTYDTGLATQLRGLLGPDGTVTLTIVDTIDQLTAMISDGSLQLGGLAGLNDQPVALAILGEPNSGNSTSEGLAGIALLTDGASGNGGLIGLSVLGGDNAGNGDLIGISVLGGANSGNSNMLGVAVLNGSNSGNGGTLAVAAINGANSGNTDFGSVTVLNGPNSSRDGAVTVAAINATSNAEKSGTADCNASGATACSNTEFLTQIDGCTDSDSDGVCNEYDQCADTLANSLVDFNGCIPPAGVEVLKKSVPLVLRGVNFEFDKDVLTSMSTTILEHAVKVLNAQPEALVSIDGHTDAKGDDDYNLRLSYRRARTVYLYLVDSGIDSGRLVYRGAGVSMPIAPNTSEVGSDSPIGRAENRRVELNILSAEDFSEAKEKNQQD